MNGRLKPLIKKFSYNAIIKECEREGWRLPTIAEVKDAGLEHSIFWVDDRPTDPADRESHHQIFNSNKQDVETVANKSFMFHVVVVVQDKRCSNCVHLERMNWCDIYDINIKETMGVPVTQFGCTTNFKVKK